MQKKRRYVKVSYVQQEERIGLTTTQELTWKTLTTGL